VQSGSGQLVASLYTQRQVSYIGKYLLDTTTTANHNLLYYSSKKLKQLPQILSHDLFELNKNLFYLLSGTIYYNGIIGVIAEGIPFTILLINQGGIKLVPLIYFYQLFFSIITFFITIPYHRSNLKFENLFTLFINQQKRIDLQAEQIALSDQNVIDVEQKNLIEKLDQSVNAQYISGRWYGLLAGCSALCNWSGTIINYAVPAFIYFHLNGSNITPEQATNILTLTVYSSYLQGKLSNLNSYGPPWSQIWTLGTKISATLDQLRSISNLHHHLSTQELSLSRRLYITSPSSPITLSLFNVDIRIPSTDVSSVSSLILVKHLNFTLTNDSSLIITGSSGCGKSTLIRLLAGLHYNLPSSNERNSQIKILNRNQMIFLPQKLHLIAGTLREQLLYLNQAKSSCLNTTTQLHDDQYIFNLLRKVNLYYLIERYTLDSTSKTPHQWSRLLSIGEQQRLIICSALLAGSNIKCLILDETTSGCDRQTEESVYHLLKEKQIQYISISHRSDELAKFHTHQLKIIQNSFEFIKL
ncbi:unnamed protein product, partial [Didymodactylos carnosus]